MFPARAAGVAHTFFLKKSMQKKQPRVKISIMSCRCKPILLVAAIIKIIRTRGLHAQLFANFDDCSSIDASVRYEEGVQCIKKRILLPSIIRRRNLP